MTINEEISEMIFILTELNEMVDDYKDCKEIKKMYSSIRRKNDELRKFYKTWTIKLQNTN